MSPLSKDETGRGMLNEFLPQSYKFYTSSKLLSYDSVDDIWIDFCNRSRCPKTT